MASRAVDLVLLPIQTSVRVDSICAVALRAMACGHMGILTLGSNVRSDPRVRETVGSALVADRVQAEKRNWSL